MTKKKDILKVACYIYLSVILVFSLMTIAGCGGGGHHGAVGTGTINGVVSGTKIIAVVDNAIVASDDTSGRTPDVDKNGDSINESFSFSLTGIPVGKNVGIYLIKEGGIFPLYFDSDGDGNPDTNVFSLSSIATIDLGFVDTDVEGQDGKAIPENDPSDNLNVTSGTENADIPTILNQPDTSGLTLSQLITEGLDALTNSWLLRAKAYFKAAEDLAGSDTSNDADTARFFYALTRVAAVGFDTYGDGVADTNSLGGILDGFGSPSDDTKRSNFDAISFPEPLPNDSSTGSDLQSFLYDVVRPELEGALESLELISNTFNKQWIELFNHKTVESDYGDVLFFRAIFKSALASIFTQSAYNLDADIDETVNNNKTTQGFLNDESDFLTLVPSPGLALIDSKNNFNSALEDLDNAIDWMQVESDSQDDDFINLGDSADAEIIQAKADIVDVKNSLYGSTEMNDNEDPDDPTDNFLLNMSVFFETGLDFRMDTPNNLLPPFTGNEVSGLFPDQTFDGIFGAGIDLNEDTDPADGIPDIFQ
ncbi:MAG: hypothetical protein JRI37_14430 [Deltaproteobacteria bacterium]|nr:hypothetical protein [Deltaproteobacteria bacterium]